MKCPNCGREGLKYNDDRNKNHYKRPKKKKRSQLHRQNTETKKGDRIKPRTNFEVICKNCGYRGE